jgi:hypothetical protein
MAKANGGSWDYKRRRMSYDVKGLLSPGRFPLIREMVISSVHPAEGNGKPLLYNAKNNHGHEHNSFPFQQR